MTEHLASVLATSAALRGREQRPVATASSRIHVVCVILDFFFSPGRFGYEVEDWLYVLRRRRWSCWASCFEANHGTSSRFLRPLELHIDTSFVITYLVLILTGKRLGCCSLDANDSTVDHLPQINSPGMCLLYILEEDVKQTNQFTFFSGG